MTTLQPANPDIVESIEPPSRVSRIDVAGVCAFLFLAALIALRLDKGTGFGDEGYYALFVDDWLKGGIDSSSYLVLHQTAALLVLPFAKLYVIATGSTDGLFLFFRALYLMGSMLTAAVVVASFRALGFGVRSWLGGLLLLAFIPFGLPAPSYNNIGLQTICIGLAAYGCGAHSGQKRAADVWFGVSTAGWAAATIAYPPLVLPACLFAALVLVSRGERTPGVKRYLLMLGATQVAGWAIVAGILSVPRLWGSLQYSSTLGEEGGLASKLSRGVDLVVNNKWYAVLCVVALALGLARRRLSVALSAAGLVGLVALCFLQPPALFVRSHDVMTLIALTAVGFMWDLPRGADPNRRLVAILVTVSLAAGVVTLSLTAYNFCIGAAFAAAVTVTVPYPGISLKRGLMAGAAAMCAIAAVLVTSLTSFYGEDMINPASERHRITEGYFAGIQASPEDARLLEIVRDRVFPLVEGQPSVVYVGRNPGVILDTPTRLRMLSAFPLMPGTSPVGLAKTAEFYAAADNRPKIMIIYRDPAFAPLNPMGKHFADWYDLARTEKTPLGSLEIYRRR